MEPVDIFEVMQRHDEQINRQIEKLRDILQAGDLEFLAIEIGVLKAISKNAIYDMHCKYNTLAEEYDKVRYSLEAYA